MIGKPAVSQQLKHSGPKYQFLVHLLKIARLPTHVPSSNVDVASRQHDARRDALKVTALYNGHQVALGDFPVCLNECIIDRKLICQFIVSKSETQSKLHLYIDQICSSGLAGHLALDLHEFIREGETEIYVKYPLYANTSRHHRGPVLKIIIKNLGIKNIEPLTEEENDILLLPHQSNEKLHNSRIRRPEDTGFTIQDVRFNPNGETQQCHVNEASLSQLEGALTEIGEKLRTLVASFKSRDCSQTGDYSGAEIDYQSSTTSPLLSSVRTGTSVDSHSEIYEEHCTDSDDLFDSSFDLGSSTYPLTIPKHSRTLSDVSNPSSSYKYSQALRQGRPLSEEAFSTRFPHSSTRGRNHEIKHHCLEECFICSSGHAFQSFEGIHSSLKSKSISSCANLLQLNALEASTARISAPLEGEPSTKGGKEEAPVPRKGSGLLKSLFGAVVVAGVSLLGVRNSNFSGGRSQSATTQAKLGLAPRSSPSSDIRSEKFSRQRYSFRR